MKVAIAICLACLFATALSQTARGASGGGGNAQQMAMLAALARRGGGGGGRGGMMRNPLMSMMMLNGGMDIREMMMCQMSPMLCLTLMN